MLADWTNQMPLEYSVPGFIALCAIIYGFIALGAYVDERLKRRKRGR